MNINIDALYNYPLKSGKGILLNETLVFKTGFKLDRDFAIINKNKVVLTARENPRILLLNTSFKDSVLQIAIPNKECINVPLNGFKKQDIEVVLFKKETKALIVSKAVNNLLSEFLKEQVCLVCTNPLVLRSVKEEYNGKPGDVISFSDIAPVHLVNEESVKALNLNLVQPVLRTRFRPNIIVSGISAYAEENWKYIKIGECEFEVIIPTKRCSLITINPKSLEKHVNQEPLRSISKLKPINKAHFGIYLIPRKLGKITTLDKIEILE